jgi:hypothetical protein
MSRDDVDERITEARRKIEIVEEFMEDIERVGGKVPPVLKRAVDRYLLASKMGVDAAEAANEVSKELRAIYADMYSICRAKAGVLPGQAQTPEQADEYFVCQAKVDRQWQARNVQKVLNWNDDGSWVRRVWNKWWRRLLGATDFGTALKSEKGLSKDAPRPGLP